MHVIGPPSAGTGTPGLQPGWSTQPVAVNSPPAGTIALNTVIGHIVQKTYHDIVVMADLLPGKSDVERKIDIAHFANRTRQLVIRLLAVVKWAGSVNKVMKCEEITQLLDQQAMLFVDTADKLHTLANQLVVQARLPNFAIPAAVDVLTTGTYPRLPKAIRDKVIPPDPITPMEKAITLKRLNEIIMHRLVLTKIPIQIADLTVDKGIAKLTVPGEFQALLTLMGDADDVPWRLLKLEFMVNDRETGGGRALVHPIQINYIHELVQSRLIANENPIEDLYKVLHSFCLSLKIEALQAQAIRLIQKRWGRLVQIDEYQLGSRVVLSYWRLTPYKSAKPEVMTVTVHQSLKDEFWNLDVTHKPPLVVENVQLVENASNVRDLSFERLLSDTIRVRTFQKLHDLQRMLKKHRRKDVTRMSRDKSCLIVHLLQPCQESDHLLISVDPQTGVYVPALACLDQQLITELEQAMNESPTGLLSWIPRLRNILAKEHCKLSVQNLPVLYGESLSLSNKSSHSIGDIKNDLIYLNLTVFNQYYVVVELLENEHNPMVVLYQYHLLSVMASDEKSLSVDVKADILIKLRTCASEEDAEEALRSVDASITSHLNSKLTQVIALCSSRIPFISLTHELAKESLLHQGILEDGADVGLCLKLITFPDIPPNILPVSSHRLLVSSLLDCSFRLLDRPPRMSEAVGMKFWQVELVFSNSLVKAELQQGNVTQTSIKLESIDKESPIKLFKDEWFAISRLYDPVLQFAEAISEDENYLGRIASIYSFDYRSLVLKYGPDKQWLVTIKWSIPNEKFVLIFGRCGSSGSNSHDIISHYLNNLFNTDPDLGKLVQVLHDTWEPLRATCSLPSIPLPGMAFCQHPSPHPNAKTVTESFVTVPQTVSHFRLVYRSTFLIDVYCLPNKKVALRDGSLSKFDNSKVIEGMLPIPGLMSFLSLFDSRRGSRQRLKMEWDNPPLVDMMYTPGPSTAEPKIIQRGHWAGSSSTVISHDMFVLLLNEQILPNQPSMSLLEHFLGLTILRRELERFVQITQDVYIPSSNLAPSLPVNDALTVFFAANSLMFKWSMQFAGNRPNLTFKVQPVPPPLLQERGIQTANWRPECLRLLEQFFRIRVAIHPFRMSSVTAFCSIICAKSNILNDFINMIDLELGNHQNDPSIRWLPQMCLTVPPKINLAPTGVPAIYVKDKILIFLQMTMKTPPNTQVNRQSIILPIVWRPMVNVTTLNQGGALLSRVESTMLQWMQSRPPNTEPLMSSAVKYLMQNLTLP